MIIKFPTWIAGIQAWGFSAAGLSFGDTPYWLWKDTINNKWYISRNVGIASIIDGDEDNPKSPRAILNNNDKYYAITNGRYVYRNLYQSNSLMYISSSLNSGNIVEYETSPGQWTGDTWWEADLTNPANKMYPLQGTFIPRGQNKTTRSNIVITEYGVDGWESSTQFGVYTKTSVNTETDSWDEFHIGFRVLTDGTNEYWEQDANDTNYRNNILEREKIYYGNSLYVWYDWSDLKWIISNGKNSKPSTGYWICDDREGTYVSSVEADPITISVSKYSEKNKDNSYGTYKQLKYGTVAVWL